MLNPLQQDVVEGYRGGLAGMQSGRGNLRSGSVNRRREDAMDMLRENMLKARTRVEGARGQYQGSLEERLRKAFQ